MPRTRERFAEYVLRQSEFCDCRRAGTKRLRSGPRPCGFGADPQVADELALPCTTPRSESQAQRFVGSVTQHRLTSVFFNR